MTDDATTEPPADDTAAPGPPPVVGVTMGSDSDLPVLQGALDVLVELGIPHEVRVTSAHRTPKAMLAYGETARDRGLRVLIAGAGGAAHLPGMLASVTSLPVVGVPVPLRHLDGMDSLLSIVQMPAGVPVATVGVGNARNAGLLAARILATGDPALAARLDELHAAMAAGSAAKDERVRAEHPAPGLSPASAAPAPPTTPPHAAAATAAPAAPPEGSPAPSGVP